MGLFTRAAPGRRVWPLLALSLLLVAAPAQMAQAARRALVVGNNQYPNLVNGTLRNAVPDARAMGEALRKAGFTVSVVVDQGLQQMQAALREFNQGIQAGDEVVFYYAGHGLQIEAQNYLLPSDTKKQPSREVIMDEAIALSRVLDGMRRRQPRLALTIIDACRSTPFERNTRGDGARGLAEVSTVPGEVVMFSANVGQEALDNLGPGDKDPNGVFTRVLLREMQRPGLPLVLLAKNVQRQVWALAQARSHPQLPALYDAFLGDFSFHPGSAPQVAMAPQPVPAQPSVSSQPRPSSPQPLPAATPGGLVPASRPQLALRPQPAPAAPLLTRAERLPSGALMTSLAEGRGSAPRANQLLEVRLRSTLADGRLLSDWPRGNGGSLLLPAGAPPCLRETVLRMKAGGRARVTCPPASAFGDKGTAIVPPRATVVYEVELLALLSQ